MTGKRMEVTNITTSADSIKRWNTWFGLGVASEGLICLGGTSYYIPKKHFFNLKYGAGIHYDGVYPFLKKDKEYELKQSIDNKVVDRYNEVRYVATFPASKHVLFGLHYGVGHNLLLTPTSVTHIKMGMTLLQAKYGQIEVLSSYGKREGGKLVTINADVIRYFHHPLPYYDSNSQTEEEYYQEIEDLKNDYGLSVNVEGYASFWSKKGVFGIKWILGVGTPPYGRLNGLFDFLYQGAFGFCFSF